MTSASNKVEKLRSGIGASLVDQLRLHELSGDLDSTAAVLERSGVWSFPFDRAPAIAGFDSTTRLTLLRHCGLFLARLCRQSSLSPDFLDRARTYLEEASFGLKNTGLKEEAFLADLQIGFTFFLDGRVEEFGFILDSLSSADLSPTMDIRLSINLLIVYFEQNQLAKAEQLINSKLNLLDTIDCPYLAAQFFRQSGLVFRKLGDYKQSEGYYRRALDVVAGLPFSFFRAHVSNNLAYMFREAGDLDRAYYHAEDALRASTNLSSSGWQGDFLDTKSLILLDLGRLSEALEAIDESIRILSAGCDHRRVCNSFQTKIEILLRSGDLRCALLTFAEAQRFADFSGADYLVKGLAQKLFIRQGADLNSNLENVTSILISESIQGRTRREASEQLGISTKKLSSLKRRLAGVVPKAKKPVKGIRRLPSDIIQGIDCSPLTPLFIPAGMAGDLNGGSGDVIALADSDRSPVPNKLLVISRNKRIFVRKTLLDPELKLFYFLFDDAPCFLDTPDIQILGTITHFAPAHELADLRVSSFQPV